MAQSNSLSEQEEADLLKLITQPLSAEQLAEYQNILESGDFEEMVSSYHTHSAITAVRDVVLGCFRQGISQNAMLIALVHVWLDCLKQEDESLDDETEASWRQMPQLLIQILLQQALDVMNEYRDELKTDYPPEFAEMYTAWQAQMPAAEAAPSEDADESVRSSYVEQQVAQINGVYKVLHDFRQKLESAGLQLDGVDYFQIWSRVLLQTYLFGQEGQSELYFILDANWRLFLTRLSEILSMMSLLKGAESLLLPENRALLTEFIAGDLDDTLD